MRRRNCSARWSNKKCLAAGSSTRTACLRLRPRSRGYTACARLANGTVASSGEVRDTAVNVSRSFTLEPDGIACTVQLKETEYNELLQLWVKNAERGKLKEAYEMIPFLPKQKPVPKVKGVADTKITLHLDDKLVGELGKEASWQTVRIDRGGFAW